MDTSLSIGSRSDAQIQRLWHGHERRAERREERREARRDDRDEAFAQLKIKVQQTLQQGAAPAGNAEDADSGSTGNGFEAEFKLSVKVSGSGDGFAGALQSFTEALFSALQTLYGNPAQSATPATPVSAPAPTDSTAVDTTATPATDAATVDTAATTDDTTDDTAAPVKTTTIATTTDTPPAPTDAATPTSPTTPSATTSDSLTIRLRLAYSSFDGQLGALTNRLAQPQTASEVPEVGAMFGDLTDRFAALQNAAGQGHDPARPSFASFLATLASSFGGQGSGHAGHHGGGASMSFYFSASLSSGRVYATA